MFAARGVQTPPARKVSRGGTCGSPAPGSAVSERQLGFTLPVDSWTQCQGPQATTSMSSVARLQQWRLEWNVRTRVAKNNSLQENMALSTDFHHDCFKEKQLRCNTVSLHGRWACGHPQTGR